MGKCLTLADGRPRCLPIVATALSFTGGADDAFNTHDAKLAIRACHGRRIVASEHGHVCTDDLLHQPRPDLNALRLLKHLGKLHMQSDPHIECLGRGMYYQSLAMALTRRAQWITTLDIVAFSTGIKWLKQQRWPDACTQRLAILTERILHRDIHSLWIK